VDTINFSCTVNTNIPSSPIHLNIVLDDIIMFDNDITTEETVSFDINEDDNDHVLRFLISGKTDLHSIKDNNDNIIDTTELSITNISFDEIDITNIIMANPLMYKHNFNGYSDPTEDKFYNIAGCNGEITLKFYTPIYLWLLENM